MRKTKEILRMYFQLEMSMRDISRSLAISHSTVGDAIRRATGHMPKAHQKHLEWTPSRIITWAGTIGPDTAKLVEIILASKPHPEQGYRACLGIIRLSRCYPPAWIPANS